MVDVILMLWFVILGKSAENSSDSSDMDRVVLRVNCKPSNELYRVKIGLLLGSSWALAGRKVLLGAFEPIIAQQRPCQRPVSPD